MPPNRFESEVESFLEGSHGDRTHIKRADHHTVTPLCGTLLCFVFSQAGITAAFVTHLLWSRGLQAFYIGQTNGYQSEVRETIREIRMLRESGLI